jgi:hypothetical protein
VWLHLLFKTHGAIPKVLVHHLVVSAESGQLTEMGGRTPVASEPAIVLGPLSLASNGLPYVIDTFDLTGRVGSTAEFDKAEREGTPLNVRNVENSGRHQHELPLDLSVVIFP